VNPDRQTVLEVEGLSRRFGRIEAIESLSLALGPGERVALWGPNGSGKSTVLRCVAGTLTPTGGEIRIAGHPAGDIEARRLLGVSLSQERSFYLRMSGRDNLVFFARLRYDRRAASRKVAEIEEELEIAEIASRRADACSSGMLQQLCFARALLGDAALLLLDEPTRSLDEGARTRFWGALDRRPDVAVVLATHRDEDLVHCGGRIDLPS
jgi:ABC-type multidrug transport system ATPase subunit